MDRDNDVPLGAGEDDERDEGVTLIRRIETLPLLQRLLARDAAADLYDLAKLRVGADPCLLFEHLGIWSCPCSGNVAFVRNGLVYYPERQSREVRGVGLLWLLGARLCPGAANCAMAELILPASVALAVEEKDLGEVQQHAPLHVVEEIFRQHHARVNRTRIDPSSRTILRAVPRPSTH